MYERFSRFHSDSIEEILDEDRSRQFTSHDRVRRVCCQVLDGLLKSANDSLAH